jgi:hypothetical protein
MGRDVGSLPFTGGRSAVQRRAVGLDSRDVVPASASFLDKASSALTILRDELPECCRTHLAAPAGA